MDVKKNLKDFWHWLWENESIWSYIVFLALVFILVKFIFLPGLGLLMGTSLPLAIVESSSMDHRYLDTGTGSYEICGSLSENKKSLSPDEYWDTCSSWYTENTKITKTEFQSFIFKNGFQKGDLMIIIGKKPESLKIGDVIVFNGGRNHPIIHRIISLNPFQTKGDHNPAQLPTETDISQNKILGKAVFKIPYIGWIKLFFVELLNKITG